MLQHLCDELDDTTGGLDLLLGLGADVAGADNDGDGNATLSEELGIAVREEVNDGGGVRLGGTGVLLALLSGKQGDELVNVDDRLPCLRVSHSSHCLLDNLSWADTDIGGCGADGSASSPIQSS